MSCTVLILALTLLVPPATLAQANDYQLGLGKSLADWLTIGGYFSTEVIQTDTEERFTVDDLAVLVYGEFADRFSYLLELESVDAYQIDFNTNQEETQLPPTLERFYFDYKASDNVSVRVGKQITPIGYWNLQPINVLRETTSNPRYSRDMFPKFITGVDIYGFTPFAESLQYHVYVQNNRDMDDSNINIAPDRHVGVALERSAFSGFSVGGSLGEFRTVAAETYRYLQLNARYQSEQVTLSTEAMVRDWRSASTVASHAKSIYAQAEYRIVPQHAVILRSEYFHDPQWGPADRIAILGYSFRPVFPVSFKIEYQWHDQHELNGIQASFSVLF